METAMRYLMILLLTGCANQISETDPPQRKADYAACEEKSTYGIFGGISAAMQVNDCMKAKGY
jgi:hypothetical protein